MYCHLNSFMGFSDSPMFLSEKDSRSPKQHLEHVSQDFDDAKKSQDYHLQVKEDRKPEVSESSLKLELPAGIADDEEEDGCKTPTSNDHKIPPPMTCPLPPRKAAKWLLPVMPKRKGSRRRVFLDMSTEIEALFPPAMLADFGNRIKKVKKENTII